jgi:quinol monooxygenase YgiN
MKVKLLFLLLSITVIYSSCGGKKSGGNVQTAENQANAPAADYKMMIIARLSVKPERAKDFVTVAREMVEKSNKESGCSLYQLYQDPIDNSKYVFVEEYKNQAAVDAHFATDYFKAFGPRIKDLVNGPTEIKVITVAKEVIK